jgi:hypothetical protein
MSSIEEHIRRSIRGIDHDFYLENRVILDSLVSSLHRWLDNFFGKRGEDYDYSDKTTKHREQRHHNEGIEEAVAYFSKIYGDKFAEIIKQETSRHIIDDIGLIPNREHYN